MSRPVAVVTGATSGIGREIALGLSKADHHVVMIGRDGARGAAAVESIKAERPGASLDLHLTDLSSLADTRALAAALIEKHPAISLLVNNAGVFSASREVTGEGHEKVLAINHLSPFVLTGALLPALQAAGRARIVAIGSDTSDRAKIDPDNLELERGWNFVRAYGQAKLAQMITTFVLAERLAGSGVTANVVHPGAVATNLIRAQGPIGLAWKIMAPFMLTAREGAETPLHVSLAPALSEATGLYFKARKAAPPNPLALNPVLRRAVWSATEQLISGRAMAPRRT